MSDPIKHECGIVLLRLLKPLSYYHKKYGTPFYGTSKLFLMMEKQRNRGQDGAGVGNIKLDMPPGSRYISRSRSMSSNALEEIFGKINARFNDIHEKKKQKLSDENWLKRNLPFTGEVFLGHLRYGTYGKNSVEYCHPFLRQNNWMTRNLVVAGNFNLTNTDELFEQLVELGQHPKEQADTVTVMEKIGHFLDEENQTLFKKFKRKGINNRDITGMIIDHLDVAKILRSSFKKFDGGYAIAGMMGHGDAFVVRDPFGIRPAFWYKNDEIAVITSERPAIQTAFAAPFDQIKEIKPGHALIIRKNGEVKEEEIRQSKEKRSCSFERIYFSRGNDADIYNERKSLGRELTIPVLNSIKHDLQNTVFSYIPNTAEVAFIGLLQGLQAKMDVWKQKEIQKLLSSGKPNGERLHEIISFHPRVEKIAVKDAKLRTFITADSARDDMVAHVYDTAYGVIREGVDNLVVLDDSIVRGTTLKKSIIRIFDRLGPKKIVIVSSAPQIRYPDCYGIDMAKLGDFIAFKAAVQLLKDKFKDNLLDEVYEKALSENGKSGNNIKNVVKAIYKPFSAEEISAKIAELLTPKGTKAELSIIYQSIEGLHTSCPNHKGDWYFTGNYPTPGGNRVVNRAFINYMEGKNVRAY